MSNKAILGDVSNLSGKTKGQIRYELIILFDRYHLKPKQILEKFKNEYSYSCVYRMYQRHRDASTKAELMIRKVM